jgi:hypothetical protein
MWPTLPPSLFLYSWLFPTGCSVCSHLLMLVPRSWIFLPWRWRWYVPQKRRLTQDLHRVTSQNTTYFILLLDFWTLSITLHSKEHTTFWTSGSVRSLELVLDMLCSVWNSRQWKKFRSPVILSYVTFPSKDIVLSCYRICFFVVQDTRIIEAGTLSASGLFTWMF